MAQNCGRNLKIECLKKFIPSLTDERNPTSVCMHDNCQRDRLEGEVRAKKLSITLNLETNCLKVTSEPPTTAGQGRCLHGQDQSAVTYPSSSHTRCRLIRLSCYNRCTRYTLLFPREGQTTENDQRLAAAAYHSVTQAACGIKA
ncbi:hypothetical protein J6590_004023 [Homalodisca vitripennis]|nr:hypothetical protein J6590_004023 [Homalodisca vitripennis]